MGFASNALLLSSDHEEIVEVHRRAFTPRTKVIAAALCKTAGSG